MFPEGPFWHDGRNYYVEVYGHRVGCWDGTPAAPVWHHPGSGPCAIERAADGGFLVPCFDAGALARLAPDGSLTAWRTHGDDGHPLTGANDVVMDGQGGAWITASGRWDVNAPPEGAVFRLGADGRLTRVVAGLHFSNGIALVDEGRTLVVAETLARRLTAFAIHDDGTLGLGRVYLNLDDQGPLPDGADATAGPDGLERHPSGDLWVCDYGAGRVHVLDATGRAKRTIGTSALYVTNVAFGRDGRHAYLKVVDQPTEAPFRGGIWRVEV